MTWTTDPPFYSDKSADVSESSPHLDLLPYDVASQDMASALGVCCLAISFTVNTQYMACLRACCSMSDPDPRTWFTSRDAWTRAARMHGSVHCRARLVRSRHSLPSPPCGRPIVTRRTLGQSASRRKLPDKSRASVESACSPPVKSAGMVSMAGMMSCSDSSYVMSMPIELGQVGAPLLGPPFTARE